MTSRFARQPLASPARRGFTLVELLVTIAIIAILASTMLVALQSSQQTARKSKSEAVVNKLHNVIIERWESYRTRRLPLAAGASRRARLSALRNLMKAEMPDRYRDLLTGFDNTETVGDQRGLQSAYLRRLPGISNASTFADVNNLIAAPMGIAFNNQSAECLFLIITVSMNADDRAVFKDREVGDTDGDDMPEFLDGWGQPIEFLRWAPGFISDFQTQDPVARHDPFDTTKIEDSSTSGKPPQYWDNMSGSYEDLSPMPTVWGFGLVPLIISPGPDQEYGLYFLHGGYSDQDENPYALYDSGGVNRWRGEADTTDGEQHFDNIHNHSLAIGSAQ